MSESERYYFKRSIIGFLLIAFLFIVPLFLVFYSSLSTYSFIEIFKDKSMWKTLLFTLYEAFLSAVFSLIIAFPFALFFSKYSFPLRNTILTLSEMCFAFPSVILILSFVIFYGNNGILNTLIKRLTGGVSIKFLYSFSSVIFAHVYLNFPIALSLITGALISSGNKEELCSYSLGKGRIKTFFRITVPKISSSILSAFTMIFLFCYSSFLIVLTLGGSVKYYTMEAEIYKRVYGDGNMSSSSSLALFSFIVTSIILFIFSFVKKKEKNTKDDFTLKKAKGKEKVVGIVLSFLILLFILPPILSIIYRSLFNKEGVFSLSSWSSIFSKDVLSSIVNTILIALSSSLLATFISYSVSLYLKNKDGRIITLLFSLPIASGSVTIGLGFLLLTSLLRINSTIFSFIVVTLCHTVILLPFSIKIMFPEVKALNPLLGLSAEVLGKREREISKEIYFPYLKRGIMRSLSFSFALSLSEVNATLTLSSGKITTLPILIYKAINTYNYSKASVLSIILLLLAYGAFYLSNHYKKEK